MSFAYDSDLEPIDHEVSVDFDDKFSGFEEEDFLALGIDPTQPTDARPGSDDKVVMLAARYSAGLPLWHSNDRYDHGPGQLNLGMLAGSDAFGMSEDVPSASA